MIPPVQATLTGSPDVVAIAGTRISQTVAPQDQARPYIVWTLISGVPQNNLSDRPERDDQRIQIDCYSADQSQARALCKAARDAIETETHIVLGPWTAFEDDTNLFRWSFDAEYWSPR